MLGAEKLDLICLEFVNLQLIMMLESNWVETGRGWLSFLNHEALSSRPDWDAEPESASKDHGDTDKPETSEGVPWTSAGMTPVEIPVVSIPDKNPSCPCCSTQFNHIDRKSVV